MSYEISRLASEHNDAALDLLDRTARAPDRRRDLFRVDRRPDFFALAAALGETRHYGAFQGATCVGTLAVSWQRRFLGGEIARIPYVHDVRVDPSHRGTRIFARLIEAAKAEGSGPFFATFLDDGRLAATLPRAVGRRFACLELACTRHRGLSLLAPRRADGGHVRPLEAAEAWRHYLRLASARDFAPADETVAMAQDGFWLGLEDGHEIVAVAKVVHEDRIRRFVARSRLRGSTLLNLWARWRGLPGLPAPGSPLRIGYLSHLAAQPRRGDVHAVADADAADTMAAFVAARGSDGSHGAAFTYLFHGVSDDAEVGAGRLDVAFRSRTYAFDHWPQGEPTFSFHELTLM